MFSTTLHRITVTCYVYVFGHLIRLRHELLKIRKILFRSLFWFEDEVVGWSPQKGDASLFSLPGVVLLNDQHSKS